MSVCLWECYNECFRLTCQVSLSDLLFPVCMYMCMCARTLSMTCGDVIHCIFISILFVRVHHCRCQLTCRRPSVRSFVRSYSNLVCLVIWRYSKSIRSEDLATRWERRLDDMCQSRSMRRTSLNTTVTINGQWLRTTDMIFALSTDVDLGLVPVIAFRSQWQMVTYEICKLTIIELKYYVPNLSKFGSDLGICLFIL